MQRTLLFNHFFRGQCPSVNPPDPTRQEPGLSHSRSDEARTDGHVVALLAVLMALLPAVGVPGEWVLQDTLKSALLTAGALAATWLWLGSRPRNLRWHGVLALPLLWLLYALGSMAWSHSYLAGVEAARWAVLGLLLWLGLQSLRPSNAMRLVWGIHAGALMASLWTAAQFWWGLPWFPQAAPPASTFINRNFFAEYAVCALPFSVLALAQLQTPRWRQLMALSLGFNVVALMMTGTRSALTALLLVAPFLLYGLWRYRTQLAWGQWSPRSRALVILVLGLGIATLGGVPSQQSETLGQTALTRSWQRTAGMAETTTFTEGSFAYRSMMWKGTARMWLDKPWTGVGAGAWEVVIPWYQGPAANEEPDYYAHNEYLQLLAEYGLPVGGGTLAVLLAYLLLAARNTWRLPPATEPQAPLRAVALCSLLALLVVSLAGFPWRLASTGALFMLNLALLAASDAHLQLRDSLGQGAIALQASMRRIFAGVVLAGSLLAGVITVQALRAETSIVRGILALNRAVLLRRVDPAGSAAAHAQGLAWVREGVAINPHYRKVTSVAADQLVLLQDWAGAAEVLHSIATSRPYIANVWANLVLTHVELHQPEAARAALQELTRLQPDNQRARALGILLLRRTGKSREAAQQLRTYFAQGIVEYDLVRFALAIGLDTQDQALTEQAYRLWVQGWPTQAQAQAGALQQAPAAWRQGMQQNKSQ